MVAKEAFNELRQIAVEARERVWTQAGAYNREP